jgi:hypothetical protein
MFISHMFSIYLGALHLASILPFGICLVVLPTSTIHCTFLQDLFLVHQFSTRIYKQSIKDPFVICLIARFSGIACTAAVMFPFDRKHVEAF